MASSFEYEPRAVVVLNDTSIKSYRHAALFPRVSYTDSLMQRIAKDSAVPTVKAAAAVSSALSSSSSSSSSSPPSSSLALAKMARINSIDFHENGGLLVSSDDLGGLSLLNVAECRKSKESFSAKFGARLVRFTHHPSCVVVACAPGTTKSSELRYLSLYDNKWLRYFKGPGGHSVGSTLVDLAQSPVDDTFCSTADDGTLVIWDVRQPTAVARTVTSPGGVPVAAQGVQGVGGGGGAGSGLGEGSLVAYDPSGVVFAVAKGQAGPGRDPAVHLFDARNYQSGPFSTFAAGACQYPVGMGNGGAAGADVGGEGGRSGVWDGCVVTPDGKGIALSSAVPGTPHIVVGAFQGEVQLQVPTYVPVKVSRESFLSWRMSSALIDAMI